MTKPLRVFIVGLVPGAQYGCEFEVLPSSTLHKVNSDRVRAARLATMAVPTDLALQEVHVNAVPEYIALQAPLVRWAGELCMLYGDEENLHLDALRANVLRQASDAITATDRPQGCIRQAVRHSLRSWGGAWAT